MDMAPDTGETIYLDWLDAALIAGQTFEDVEAGIQITTEWVNDNGAAVIVLFGEPVVATDLAVYTDQPTYTLNQKVTITANATAGGAPKANSSVTFILLKANGTSIAETSTTDSSGKAVYNFRLKRQDPVEFYKAKVEMNGGIVSAFADFMVN